MNTKRTFVLISLCLIFFCCKEKDKHIQTKINEALPLRILYVGGSGNWEDEYYKSDEERKTDVERRIKSFKDMLQNFFSEVVTVRSEDYKEAISENYDVTIMDDYLKILEARKIIRDSTGKVINDIPTSFFSEKLTKPMLLIGNFSSMTSSLGSKLDWYCKCLGAHAFNYDIDHPIFKEPFLVSLSTEEVLTPQNAYNFEHFFDESTPKKMQMLRIQTKGYETDKGFRVGMVSRPGGFNDSPEAESISSGVCSMRNFDAVALGRHGNFFHWGFAASPEYMTEQGQSIFANAVYYISKFNKKGIIARKRDGIIPTRGQYFRELIYFINKEVYENQLRLYSQIDEQLIEKKKNAQQKVEKGEVLTSQDSSALLYRLKPKKTYSVFLKDHHGIDLYNKFGTNAKAYRDYYINNKDYFYSKPFLRELILDEDVKTLKIPNHDIRLLDKCITLLENDKDVEKAKRILKRYTLLDFSSVNQWRNWYEKYKDKLFFTEAGGFVFLVNSYDKNVEGNNYFRETYQSAPSMGSVSSIIPSKTDSYNPVTVATGLIKKGDNKKEIIVKLKIHKGYHLYANVSETDPYIATDLKIDLPKGYSKIGNLKEPSFEYYNENGTTIYTGEITFSQEITGNGSDVATCYLTWQTCEEDFCLPPVFDEPFQIELP